MEETLTTEFFLQPTLVVARALLGKRLIRRFPEGAVAVGRVVETEAYTSDDPACHSFRGQTVANRAMFGPPGTAYIHINYGLHYCLNAVTGPEGVAEAVLIRAIEPVENAALMYRNYTGEEAEEAVAREERRLGAGPGRLTRSLQIDRAHSGKSLNGARLTDPSSSLYLAPGDPVPDEEVVITTRIGITKAADYPWRFYIRSSRFVSRKGQPVS